MKLKNVRITSEAWALLKKICKATGISQTRYASAAIEEKADKTKVK